MGQNIGRMGRVFWGTATVRGNRRQQSKPGVGMFESGQSRAEALGEPQAKESGPTVVPLHGGGTTPNPDEVWGVVGNDTRAQLLDVSNWGARIVVSSEPALEVGDTTRFEIRNNDRILIACDARVMGLAEFDIGCEVGLWILTEEERWQEAVSRISPRQLSPTRNFEPTPNPNLPADRIAPRLRALAASHARAQIRSMRMPDGPAIPARLDPERGLLMEWHPQIGELKPPFNVQVEGPFSTVNFTHDSLNWAGLPEPRRATVMLRRRMRRVAVPSGAKVLLRGLGDGDVDLRMHDVSFGGVSATLDPSISHLTPGTVVPEVILTWRGGPGLRFTGEIRHRSNAPHPGSEKIGLALSGAPEDQRERWAREVETLLYPSTRSYGHNYTSIWNLFEESGYFDISECTAQSSDFMQLRSSFESSYGKISAAPDLGCLATWESPTRVEASIAGLRLWSKSWFGMQLARNPVRPHIARSDSMPLKDIIFHVFERAGANPDLDWVVHYVRDDAPSFSRVLFRDLILSIPGSCGVPFEVWKFGVSMLGDWSVPQVSVATCEQVGHVLRKLEAIRPKPYLEALDLTPDTFGQEELQHEWNVHGLLRERDILVAMDGGKVVAAALLEACEDGLHLYGLLDGVRLFEIEPGGRDHFGALLLSANEWFYAMGKSNFVCFDENGMPEMMRSAGAKSMGRAVTTYLPRHATPELLERVAEITTPK